MHKGRGKNKGRKICFIAIGILFLIGLLVMTVYPTTKSISVEAGEKPETDPAFYLRVTKFSKPYIKLSKPIENIHHVGQTEMIFTYFGIVHFKVGVEIVDTTAPSVELCTDVIGMEPGEKLMARSVLEGVEDNADTECEILWNNKKTTITYDSIGEYENEIIVRDASGNQTNKQVQIYVANPPEISSPEVLYVETCSEIFDKQDFLKYISAYDEKDGMLQENQIQLNMDGFHATMESEYDLYIRAINSFGVDTTKKIPVKVVDYGKLTQKIVDDKVDITKCAILSADKGNEVEWTKKENISSARQMVEPTLVNIYYTLENNGYAYGNGFVVDMTEDEVYIASNYHVLCAFPQKRAKITLGNGYTTGEYEYVGGNEAEDIAFIRIRGDDLPTEVFDGLKEAKISLARAYTIEKGEKLFQTSLFYQKESKTKEGSFVAHDDEIFNGNSYTTFTVEIEEGDSGSAIYDAYGYLISMCVGIAKEDGHRTYCGVLLENIVKTYEAVTGNKLYAF